MQLNPARDANGGEVLSEEILDELRSVERARPGSVAELVGGFLHSQKHFLESVQRGLIETNPAAIRRGAHMLKGAAGCLGAVRLSTAAAAFEEALASGDAASAHALLDRVLHEFGVAASALRARFPAEHSP